MSRILIVDDEQAFVRSVVAGLSSADAGYELLSASNGLEAVEVLGSHGVDLVLTDLKMPDMGGYELVAYLGRHHPTIPLILMTAYGTPELEQNFRVLGIYRYLEKPVDLQDVAATVADALAEAKRTQDRRASGRSGRWLLGLLADAAARGSNGEVVVRRRADSGRVFVSGGKVTWVVVSTAKQDLLSYLMEHTDLTQEDLTIVFDDCRRESKDFGTTLVSWGMIDADLLRQTTRRLISSSLLELLRWDDTEAMFLPDERPPPGLLAFDFDEIVEGLRELDASSTLEWSLRPSRYSYEPEPSGPAGEGPALNGEPAAPSLSPKLNHAARERDRYGLERELERLAGADGFRGVGAFSASGALLANVSQDHQDLETYGPPVQEILVEAQRLSEHMQLGDRIIVRVSTPEVEILVRTIRPASSPSGSSPRDAHLLLIFVIERQGNVELARVQLDRVARALAARDP